MKNRQREMGIGAQGHNNKRVRILILTFALLAITFALHGAVVYTNVNPDSTITSGDIINIDINNDNIPDFQMTVDTSSGVLKLLAGVFSGNAIAGETDSSGILLLPFNLNFSEAVDTGLNFIAAALPGFQILGVDTIGLGLLGNWGNETNKYLGVSFTIGPDTHYGWIRLDTRLAGVGAPSLTVTGYAYEDEPHKSIRAGVVPANEATNVLVTDIADNNNGSDMEVAFSKTVNDSTAGEFRIIVVKKDSAAAFNLTKAQAVALDNYKSIVPVPGSFVVDTLDANASDNEGDPVESGVPYYIFVLTIADGVNANTDVLSAPSNEITLRVPADPATGIVAADVANNGNGSDLQVSFNRAANENTILEYRVIVVNTDSAAAFDLAKAESVTAGNYTIVAPTGSNVTQVLDASANDFQGNPIVLAMPYRVFVLSVADSLVAYNNALSSASNEVTLHIPAGAVTNVLGTDTTDNGNGSDMIVTFTKAADESRIGQYRIIVVKSADAAGFNVTAAEAVIAANYRAVSPTGNNLKIRLSDTATVNDGDSIVSGVPYRIFVLSIANSNATQNSLSAASPVITLHIQVMGATNVVALDVANNSDGSDLLVSFTKAPNEADVEPGYRVMVVKWDASANFSLAAATAVIPARYTDVPKTGNDISLVMAEDALDVNGDAITIGQPYRVFVLTIANGTTTTLNSLSASNQVTLNTPADTATNVTAADVNNNNNGTDMRVSFTNAADESKVAEYRIMVVKAGQAATFDLAQANSIPPARYTRFDKTGGSISSVLSANARDTDHAPIISTVAYRVFVLTVADGIRSNVNSLSEPSEEITLIDNSTSIEDHLLAGIKIYSYGHTIYVSSKEKIYGNAGLLVFNIMGQEVYRTILNNHQEDIRLENMPEGIYLVHLRLEEGLLTRKVHISNP